MWSLSAVIDTCFKGPPANLLSGGNPPVAWPVARTANPPSPPPIENFPIGLLPLGLGLGEEFGYLKQDITWLIHSFIKPTALFWFSVPKSAKNLRSFYT